MPTARHHYLLPLGIRPANGSHNSTSVPNTFPPPRAPSPTLQLHHQAPPSACSFPATSQSPSTVNTLCRLPLAPTAVPTTFPPIWHHLQRASFPAASHRNSTSGNPGHRTTSAPCRLPHAKHLHPPPGATPAPPRPRPKKLRQPPSTSVYGRISQPAAPSLATPHLPSSSQLAYGLHSPTLSASRLLCTSALLRNLHPLLLSWVQEENKLEFLLHVSSSSSIGSFRQDMHIG